jgi:hypothetical protein
MVTKQSYIPFNLDVVLFLPLHAHNHVENILEQGYDRKDWSSIRKLPENTSLYPIENFCLPD